jgi:Mrp family chromosome partitioning ATPase
MTNGIARATTPKPLLPFLENNGRLATLIQAWTLGQQAHGYIQSWRQRRRNERTYTIAVGDRDLLYADLHEWLLERVPPSRQRSLMARTSYQTRWSDDGVPDGNESVRVRYFYGGTRVVALDLDGDRVEVMLEQADQGDDDGKRRLSKFSEDKIVFTMRSQRAQGKVMAVLEALAQKQRRPETPKVLVPNKWGDWMSAKMLTKRDPSTVVLAEGQMERLSAELGQFLEAEKEYADLGQPWHFGMLLFGPPGTGKSSAAMALALSHKLDVYYLPLGDLESDVDLFSLLAKVPDRSVLLLEDADGHRAVVDREQTKDDLVPSKLSSSGLLNALDGVLTPHGLVTIITTNKPWELDAALTRAGRCDLKLEIGHLTDEQLSRLVEKLVGRTGPLPSVEGRQVAAADVTRCVRAHIKDKDAAHAAIVDFLKQQRSEAA